VKNLQKMANIATLVDIKRESNIMQNDTLKMAVIKRIN
jgi:hypothetical protein